MNHSAKEHVGFSSTFPVVMPHVIRYAGANNDSFHTRQSLNEIKRGGHWQQKAVWGDMKGSIHAAWKQANKTKLEDPSD